MNEFISSAKDFPNSTNSVVENIKCFVRCRPLNEKEKDLGAGCIKILEEKNSIIVENKTETKNAETKPFTMDLVFSDVVTQEEIFQKVAVPVLEGFLQGFNCTIFAYGQTGAGKTHTMLGPLDSIFEISSENHGFIPRILSYLFDTEELKRVILDQMNGNQSQSNSNQTNLGLSDISHLKMDVKCSCLEIYQEQIIDLLTKDSLTDSNKLVIREDKRGMFIEGLTEMKVKSDKAAKELIMLGLKNRHVAATNMNAESSRSHLIFTIYMDLSYTQADVVYTRSSRLHLIDLAGSERQKATKAVGERIKEAGMINKSLSTLGNVINALVEMSEGKTKYVPFRDSKLTHFLKDSLGGNAKTTIIANISQSTIQMPETVSTLKFVQRAKMIKNKAYVNENVNDTVKVLQTEIKKLKEELSNVTSVNTQNGQFICPYCSNKNTNTLHESNDSHKSAKIEEISPLINTNINILISKIEGLFTYETSLINKISLVDPITLSFIQKFFQAKEVYENDYSILIEDLEKRVKTITNLIKFKENILLEIKDEISKFKNGNIVNNLFVEKINSFADELLQFKLDFEINQMLNITKLKEENKQLKNELEALNYLKSYYIKKSDTNVNDQESNSKLVNLMSRFMESNKEIKLFFSEHFGIDGDEKITNTLNNLNAENVNESQDEKYTLIEKKDLEKLKFMLEESKINEENSMKLIDDLQSETFLLNMELKKFKEEHNIVNVGVSNKNTNLEENTTANIPSNSFINNLRNSLIETSPNKNVLRSSLLYTSRPSGQNLPEMNMGERISLTKENIELIKLKERLDDALINLEEKNKEFDELHEQIDFIETENDNLKFEKEKLQVIINSINDDKLTMNEEISSLNSEIVILNSKINNICNFFDQEYSDSTHNLAKIDENLQEMSLIYTNDLDTISKFFYYYQKLLDKYQFINKENFILSENLENHKLRIDSLSKENADFKMDINNYQNEGLKLKNENEKFMQELSILQKEKLNLLDDLNIFQEDNAKLVEENENLKLEMIKERNDTKLSLQSSFNDLKKFEENYKTLFLNIESKFENKISILLSKIKSLSNKVDSLQFSNESLKLKSLTAIKENIIFREKIKNLFGSDFNFGCFLDPEVKEFTKLLNWNKLKLSKLEKKILELKEEKKHLKMDISLLHIDFTKGLSDASLNNKIQLLMRIKEENYKLKMELIEFKKKNEILEKHIFDLESDADTGNFKKNVSDNLEDYLKIRREHSELLSKIKELDSSHKIKFDNNFSHAMEVLKDVQEIVELHNFQKNIKYTTEIVEINSSQINYNLSTKTTRKLSNEANEPNKSYVASDGRKASINSSNSLTTSPIKLIGTPQLRSKKTHSRSPSINNSIVSLDVKTTNSSKSVKIPNSKKNTVIKPDKAKIPTLNTKTGHQSK